jgi:hypothetical protein
MTHTEARVQLLNGEHVSVAEGFMTDFKEGDVLHTLVLQRDEVGVYVTNVLNKKHIVSEPFLELLEECVNTCIRWKQECVVPTVEAPKEEVLKNHYAKENAFHIFEWTDGGEDMAPSGNCAFQHIEEENILPYEHGTRWIPHGAVQYGIHYGATQSETVHGVQGVDDSPIIEKKRRYEKKKHSSSKKSMERPIGENRDQKVSLQSVRTWKEKSTCNAKCILNINEMEIMDVRYEVWANRTNPDDRVIWILRQMRTFMETNEVTGWANFKFRVASIPVCSACYAHALGYSRRQLERWKDDIRTRDRRSACHGNALKPHESNHIVAA